MTGLGSPDRTSDSSPPTGSQDGSAVEPPHRVGGEAEPDTDRPSDDGLRRGATVDLAALAGTAKEAATRTSENHAEPPVPLHVRVVHGSMEQATYPVAAGRYKGIPIEGALAYLNERLDNSLRVLQDFDLLPEEAGAARYVPPLDPDPFPKGAIVIGLGDFGLLSATRLTKAMERGAIQYALACRTSDATIPKIGVSSVLIGTPGRYGLSVAGSILAIVQGVARASARLTPMVHIDQLEFIELYEGKAEEAAISISNLQTSKRFDALGVDIVPAHRIDERPGGRPGSGGYEQSGAPWLRVALEVRTLGRDGVHDSESDSDADSDAESVSETMRQRVEPTSKIHRATEAQVDTQRQPAVNGDGAASLAQELRWVSLGRSAQAEHLKVRVALDEIRQHVEGAVAGRTNSEQALIALYEMLFPNDVKVELDENDNLHLLVDKTTAWIPWELVTGRQLDGEIQLPLARRAGVLRQLKPSEAPRHQRAFTPSGKKALVIGDPPTRYRRLPRARAEARKIAELLDERGYEVKSCIYDEDDRGDRSREIREAFFADHYRIVHIAAHGLFAPNSSDPLANGVVIGRTAGRDLLTGNHFARRQVRPDLVFLNCCHVGRIDEPADDLPPQHYSELAADMSVELMKTGVRAVVAAGWAVIDGQAEAFAERFYESMINGAAFGESVNEAREASYAEHSNTWGAFQCYGDPDFQFRGSTRRWGNDSDAPVSRSHLIKQIQVLGKQAGDKSSQAKCREVVARLRKLEHHLADEHFEKPEVWEAFGAAYGEAGHFDSAVFCYAQAHDKESNNAKALEQLVNLRARLAGTVNRGEDNVERSVAVSASAAPSVVARRLCDDAMELLDKLMNLKETAERHIIKGSLHKRLATIDGENKIEHLRMSRDAYHRAAELQSAGKKPLSIYPACLAVQMAYIAAAEAQQAAKDDTEWFEDYLTRLSVLLDRILLEEPSGDYYRRARPIDIQATQIIASGQLLGDTDGVPNQQRIINGFSKQFRVRSSARHRLSVEHHYRELAELLPEHQRAAAARIADELGAFGTGAEAGSS